MGRYNSSVKALLVLSLFVVTGWVCADDVGLGLEVYPGYEVKLVAREPDIGNPTNIAVDHRGRVWICDVMNYRKVNRPEGDRILILEDKDGDGSVDETKVFYQGGDIDAALGICVLGNMVYVTCAPHLIVLTDQNGDDVPDKKEYLFTDSGRRQDDHSTHSVVFGPDGRIYWNMGNNGESIHDAEGNPVKDLFGYPVRDRLRLGEKTSPYMGGMVFRFNPDGSRFEVLGHNFRNNYEVAVDSFGNVWQSDNDDDGNYGARLTYTLEYGNHGYRDEWTGAGWRKERISQHPDVSTRHWHQNDPGVIPNFAQTGAGSPAGITVYEGDLLPEIFQGQVIHCDPGPGVVWGVVKSEDGAGYFGETHNLVKGYRDRWFRPVDVDTGPDGTVYFSDWHDPVLGWNRQGDIEHGRIFRLAPHGHSIRTQALDYSNPEHLIYALKSPNMDTRYRGWIGLSQMGLEAMPYLMALSRDKNPIFRARAIWLMSHITGGENGIIELALQDSSPDIRLVGLRAARQQQVDMRPLIKSVTDDPSSKVRAEAAIAVTTLDYSEVAEYWNLLAATYKPGDRWFLEALGIGARANWDACLQPWIDDVTMIQSPAGRDILWRSRATETSRQIFKILSESEIELALSEWEVKKLLRAMEVNGLESVPAESYRAFIDSRIGHSDFQSRVILSYLFKQFSKISILDEEGLRQLLNRYLDTISGTREFIDLVAHYQLEDKIEELKRIVRKSGEDEVSVSALQYILEFGPGESIDEVFRVESESDLIRLVKLAGRTETAAGMDKLAQVVVNDLAANPVREAAVSGLALSRRGQEKLVAMAESGEFPDHDKLKAVASAGISNTLNVNLRNRASHYFPMPALKGSEVLPQMTELLTYSGNIQTGREVFNKSICISCHQLDGSGINFGPELSGIGARLSKQGLYEAIIHPDASISPSFQSVSLETHAGETYLGFIISETESEIILKLPGGNDLRIPLSEIKFRNLQSESLMPSGLQATLTLDELVDLVEFLSRNK